MSLITWALAISIVGWSCGASAQSKPPSAARAAAPPCEVCLTLPEWEQAERDAARADRFDRLQEAHTACDVERLEGRGARRELAARAAECEDKAAQLGAELALRGAELQRAELRAAELARQRWIFAGGASAITLAIVAILAVALD